MLGPEETAASRLGAAEENALGVSAALRYLAVEAERLGLEELAGLIREAAKQAVIESKRIG